MIGENGTPETPEWRCEPRACGLCDICETPSQSAFMHLAGEKLGDNIVLGDE